MKISVVMCTYNGEKYIFEQLESIYNQIRRPDEVIIQDDRSTDSTVSIINDFIKCHNLDANWCLYVNESNLGWKKNFMTAIKRASGDVIFLSDQDDIWYEDKIKKMSDICQEGSEIDLLVCRHYPFDSDTGERVKYYQPIFGRKELEKVVLSGAFAECGRPGCTYAIRGIMKQYIDTMWKEEWPHDQFFWCVALAKGTLFSLEAELIKFRRHEANNSPDNKKSREIRGGLMRVARDISEVIENNADVLKLECMKNEKLRSELGKNARQKVLDGFSIKIMHDKFDSHISKVISDEHIAQKRKDISQGLALMPNMCNEYYGSHIRWYLEEAGVKTINPLRYCYNKATELPVVGEIVHGMGRFVKYKILRRG